MIEKKLNLLKRLLLFLLLVQGYCPTAAQKLYTSKYGVPRILHFQDYRLSCHQVPEKMMIELKSAAPSLQYDLRYAGKYNFTGRPLYPPGTAHTFLRQLPAQALVRVQQSLQRQQLGLKIFDAYRPYHVTELFWELIGDERYVAHPAKGSGHNRGLAVDLTLVDLQTGRELEMGTAFDNFSDTAHHTFLQLPEPVLKNRRLLREIMMQNGFQPLETEWWHYFWPNDKHYEVLDLPIKILANRPVRK